MPEYELCFVRVLTINACGQALTPSANAVLTLLVYIRLTH